MSHTDLNFQVILKNLVIICSIFLLHCQCLDNTVGEARPVVTVPTAVTLFHAGVCLVIENTLLHHTRHSGWGSVVMLLNENTVLAH